VSALHRSFSSRQIPQVRKGGFGLTRRRCISRRAATVWWIGIVATAALVALQPAGAQGIAPDQNTSLPPSSLELCPGIAAPSCDLPSCDAASSAVECRRQIATRDCSACLVRNPFGGCAVRGNDPVCEATKASQNASHASEFAACEERKISAAKVCIAAREQALLQCEVRKSAALAACELRQRTDSRNGQGNE
jgi:hypothetical protein